MGLLLMAVVVIASVFFMVKAVMALYGNHRARFQAVADRGRVQRENPSSPEAQLSDGEFALKLMKEYPLVPVKPVVIALDIGFIGIPVSCAVSALSIGR